MFFNDAAMNALESQMNTLHFKVFNCIRVIMALHFVMITQYALDHWFCF